MTNPQLAIHLFLQLAVILVVCRAVGLVAARFGQPQVVAEMLAGILLGPSLFGLLLPEAQSWLFPWDKSQTVRDTQSYLFPISQLGLAVYMFIVGLEFRLDIVRQHLRAAVAVSVAGMVVPFVLGALLAWVLYRTTNFFPAPTTELAAMLFVGASMCITAFPTLARIIEVKGITGTTVGTVSLAAGAINDVAAWCLLALVLATGEHSALGAVQNIGLGVLYVALVIFVVAPLLRRWQHGLEQDGTLTESGMALCLAMMALGAWFTDLIGLHAVFGAFVMGVAMPRGAVTRDLIARAQPLTVAVLLPLFFTFSGLNTKLSLLNTLWLWLMCGAVLLVATVGKGVACWLAARAAGIPRQEALAIGTLMNARGLMELIIINIGLQRGLISEGLFAALALMALMTTLMTVPLFDRVMRARE
jgi:Kef-type K+ transport system membrane component KefB